MSAHSFEDLIAHRGHNLVCVGYGKFTAVKDDSLVQNISVECIDCNEVILSYDKWEEVKKK